MGFVYLGLTILFTVYGQIVIKWQLGQAGTPPIELTDKVIFLLRQYLNPWVISGLVAAFVASVTWMATLTEFDLSFAYPFMSLSYVVVLAASLLIFSEPFTPQKVIGTLVIIIGLIIISR